MSSAVVALPNHTFATVIRKAFARAPITSAGTTSYSGPSTFDVPESLTIEAQPRHIVFAFDYPDNEKPEVNDRSGSADGSIRLRLGENTKRVLRVEISGDVDELLSSKFQVARDLQVRFSDTLSNQERNSYRLNSALVGEILGSMPDKVIDELKRTLAATSSKELSAL